MIKSMRFEQDDVATFTEIQIETTSTDWIVDRYNPTNYCGTRLATNGCSEHCNTTSTVVHGGASVMSSGIVYKPGGRYDETNKNDKRD